MYNIEIIPDLKEISPTKLQLDYFGIAHKYDKYDIRGATIQVRGKNDFYSLKTLLSHSYKNIRKLLTDILSWEEGCEQNETFFNLIVKKKGHEIIHKKVNALCLIGAKNGKGYEICKGTLTLNTYAFFDVAIEIMISNCWKILTSISLDAPYLHIDTEVLAEKVLQKIKEIANG